MFDDKDIKIAGDRPSATIRKNKANSVLEDGFSGQSANGNIEKAKLLGRDVAEKFCEAGDNILPDAEASGNAEMQMRRQQLLAFGVLIGFERFCPNETLADSAWSAFEKRLKEIAPSMYDHSTDNGAFSFYFLAYRRGGDIERRMGQTFAMLCSHDGDPIYQELGEALYCWYTSYIQKRCEAADFS